MVLQTAVVVHIDNSSEQLKPVKAVHPMTPRQTQRPAAETVVAAAVAEEVHQRPVTTAGAEGRRFVKRMVRRMHMVVNSWYRRIDGSNDEAAG
jgi:hypothetical protein